MCRLSICDDVDKHFHSLKQEFNATDNFNLWQALTSKGEKILQGDALEEETHSEVDTSMINQDEDDAPKKTGEMSKSAKANLEGSSSQTEVPPKPQKYERLAQDEHDAPNKTGQTAIAGSSKMRVGKEGGVLGDARKSAKANLEKVTILSIHTITFNLEHPLRCIFYIIIWDTLPHRRKEGLVLIMERS